MFGKIWNENNERLSRLVFKMWHFIVDDVLGKFRNNSLKNYGLLPSHYLSAPGWDAMLKMTKLNLNLFQILKCMYYLRKVQEVEFLIFSIDTARPIINT